MRFETFAREIQPASATMGFGRTRSTNLTAFPGPKILQILPLQPLLGTSRIAVP
jgi:hypothetical protein